MTRRDVPSAARGEWNQYLLREFRHCVWRRVRPNVWRLSLRGGVWKREGHLEPKILVEIFCEDDEARLRLAELEWRWHESRSPRRRTD